MVEGERARARTWGKERLVEVVLMVEEEVVEELRWCWWWWWWCGLTPWAVMMGGPMASTSRSRSRKLVSLSLRVDWGGVEKGGGVEYGGGVDEGGV